MITNKIRVSIGSAVALIVLGVTYSNCSQSGFSLNNASGSIAGSSVTSTPAGSVPLPAPGTNIMTVQVGGYTNEPYVSVTICVPGTTNCAVIPNILLDTGSSGLRIFTSAVPTSISSSLVGNGFAECMSYGDDSVQWGPIRIANVQLASETATSVPIQIIDSSYGDSGSGCLSNIVSGEKKQGTYDASNPPFMDAAGSYYNGILGVSFLSQDCGADCVSFANNYLYYTCSGGTCSQSAVALAQQVVNPISLMPLDNNGLILQLPSVPSGVANNLSGYAILGIGTQSNNQPLSGVLTLSADPNESDNCFSMLQTKWNNNTICGFIDSGSNSLVFPYSNTSVLPEDSNLFYVPSTVQNFSAVNVGFNNVQSTVSFSVGNMTADFASYNILSQWAVNDPSGPIQGTFDWGLPFFLGRTVYVGLENTSSPLGSGIYWAY